MDQGRSVGIVTENVFEEDGDSWYEPKGSVHNSSGSQSQKVTYYVIPFI